MLRATHTPNLARDPSVSPLSPAPQGAPGRFLFTAAPFPPAWVRFSADESGGLAGQVQERVSRVRCESLPWARPLGSPIVRGPWLESTGAPLTLHASLKYMLTHVATGVKNRPASACLCQSKEVDPWGCLPLLFLCLLSPLASQNT